MTLEETRLKVDVAPLRELDALKDAKSERPCRKDSYEIKHCEKVMLAMVGLPARGKSYISHKIVSYLTWLGIKANIFNVGEYRRACTAKMQSEDPQNADFFNSNNAKAKELREQMAFHILNVALQWLFEGGQVAIFDATNTTAERRSKVLEKCKDYSACLQVIFIESVCDDPEVIESNLKEKIRRSPDYKDLDPAVAMEDLRRRIENYQNVYETILDDRVSYIKLINLQSKVVCNRIYGRTPHLLVAFLMSIHVTPRSLYLCRPGHIDKVIQYQAVNISEVKHPVNGSLLVKNGQSHEQNGVKTLTERDVICNHEICRPQRTGSAPETYSCNKERESFLDSNIPISLITTSQLSSDGNEFARKLAEFMQNEVPEELSFAKEDSEGKLQIYTSTLPRAIQTVSQMRRPHRSLSVLNSLDLGIYHGMTVDQIQSHMAREWGKFEGDRLHYRLPGGECYGDVIQRLSPFVIDLEREKNPILIVTHLNILQLLYGYLLGKPIHECLKLEIPTHTIIKFSCTQYGWTEERYNLSV